MAPDRQQVSRKRLALGMGLGIAGGLLVPALLGVRYGAEALRNVVFATSGLIVIIPVLAGLALGRWLALRGSSGAGSRGLHFSPFPFTPARMVGSDMPRMSWRRRVLGIVLGIGAGLLVDSLTILKFRVLILYFLVSSLGTVLILPFAVGIYLGIMLCRKVSREPSWWALILLAIVLWPAVTVAPWGARIVQLRFMARRMVPDYPGARSDKTSVDLGDFENTGDSVRLLFHAEADSSSILDFYRDALASRDWEPGPKYFIETRRKGTAHWFKQKTTVRSLRIKFGAPNPDGALPYEIVCDL